MVWEQGSGVLVMLTRLNEQVVKCAPYFPDAAGSSVAYGARSASPHLILSQSQLWF